MSQSGAAPPVHSRRHRTEMNQNNANESPLPITAAARFGETEWEARDVRIRNSHLFILKINEKPQELSFIYHCNLFYLVTKAARA